MEKGVNRHVRDEDNFLTISEAAQFLKVSKTSLRRWSNEGRLRCYRVGSRGERRFRQGDLLAFVYGAEGLDEEIDPSSISDQEIREHEWLGIRAPCHLCTMFKVEDEQWQQVRSYLLEHLMPDAQTVYVYYGEPDKILDRISAEGINAQYMIDKGRLQMVPWTDAFLPDGCFDPERMLRRYRDTIDRFSTMGIRKLLVAGEMEWCAKGIPGSEHLIEYEEALDKMLVDYPWVTAICQYSLTDIPAATIFDNLCVHSYVQTANGAVSGLNMRKIV